MGEPVQGVIELVAFARAVNLGTVAGGQDGGFRPAGHPPGQRFTQAVSVGSIWSMANANRPRRSSGAVVWLMPRAQTAMRVRKNVS
jgi:hypothetical protein